MKTICAFKERSLLIIVFLNLTIFILAQNGFYIKPQAQWVKKVQYNPNIETSPVDKDDGGTYLLVDIQQNVELEEIYKHNVVRIDEESGIQNYADIWIEYDPSYQTLHFHKLVIHRNNHELNRLKKEEFKIVQNESQLDSKIYTGNYSAGIYIEDVQLGDIIEYAYTIKGENPVFEGKCFEVFSLEYSIPIIKYFLQISYPAERNINYKLINSKIKPIKSFSNGLVFLTWDLDNCPEVVLNSNLPSWYIGYSKVQLSEFSSWREVIQWGSQLYPEQEIKNTSLEQKLQEITSKFSKKNDRINAIIRFVQDEIRYVGIEVNINSHKPHDPIEVYSKRYGDCKDKTYLLVTLLRNQGINARPAYVNTSLKQNILLYSPSPTVFNHVILSIEYDGELYFIDPTISNQRGDFKEAYIGNYKRALVLDLKYNEPVVVPLQASEKIVIDEYIEVEDSIMVSSQ